MDMEGVQGVLIDESLLFKSGKVLHFQPDAHQLLSRLQYSRLCLVGTLWIFPLLSSSLLSGSAPLLLRSYLAAVVWILASDAAQTSERKLDDFR